MREEQGDPVLILLKKLGSMLSDEGRASDPVLILLKKGRICSLMREEQVTLC